MPKGGRGKKKKGSQRNHVAEWKKVTTKKRGKKAQYAQQLTAYSEQLAKLQLYIRDITGDGNCLFRAIADQICSNEHQFHAMRETLCDFVEASRDDFEPFIEDDEPFDDYLDRMRQNGEWGGNFELAAAVQCFGVNIVVHNFQAPRYQLTCHNPGAALEDVGGGTIHLSYHDGEHYNSVRIEGDVNRSGRAQATRTVKMLKDPTATPSADKLAVLKNISRVAGCVDMRYVQEKYAECDDDEDATIECLIAELAAGAEWKTNKLYQETDKEGESQRPAAGEDVWSKVENKKKAKRLTKKEKKAEKRRQRQLNRQSGGGGGGGGGRRRGSGGGGGGGGGGRDTDDSDDDIQDEFGALVI